MGWPQLRRYLAAAAALLLAAAGLGAAALAGAAPARAATGCSVAYSLSSQWGTGFTAAVTITNLGAPLTSWTLGYSYAGNQQLSQGWSGTWSQSGSNVTVASASWNGSLATSGSTQIGANFSYSGTNPTPTAFTLNGVACTGQTTGPGGSGGGSPSPGPAPQLHVSGSKLLNPAGQQVILRGGDRSGSEYDCAAGSG